MIKKYKKHSTVLSLFIFLVNIGNVFSQSEADLSIQKIIAEIYENSEVAYDYSELYDKLSFYYNNPLNINEAEADDLKELFFLTENQIQAILDYKKRFLSFYSVYEFMTIEALDIQTIQYLLHFIKIERVYKKKRNKSYFLPLYGNRLQFRTERVFNIKEGILQDTHYLGNPFKMYMRFYHQPDKMLSYGFTAEKDAGEEFLKGSQPKGFDFYSVHFFYKPTKGILKTVAIGDYYADFGQGLVFSNAFSMGKSIYFEQAFKSNNKLSPYRSVNESGFLRGTAMTLAHKNISFTSFYSNKKIDAGIELSAIYDSLNDYVVETIDESGYHRTLSEIEKKNNLR